MSAFLYPLSYSIPITGNSNNDQSALLQTSLSSLAAAARNAQNQGIAPTQQGGGQQVSHILVHLES